MRSDDDLKYFEEPGFKETLAKYEAAREAGQTIYMDADELTDVAEYYSMVCHDEDRAAEAIDLALQLHPDAVDPQVFRARNRMFNGEMDAARIICDSIQDQQHREVIFLRAELLLREQKNHEALLYLQEMRQSIEEDADYFIYDSAYIFMDYHDFAAAQTLSEELEAIAPTWFKTLELRADVLLSQDLYEQALPYIERMLDIDPFYVDAWNWSCEVYCGQAKYDRALESVDYGLAVEPQNERSLQLKAWVLIQQEQFQEAHQLYLALQKINPSSEQHYYFDSFCLEDMEDLSAALAAVEKAELLSEGTSPEQLGILEQYAHLLSVAGDVDGALRKIDEAEAFQPSMPGDDPDYDMLRVRVYAENEQPQLAMELVEKSSQCCPDNPVTPLFRGSQAFYENGYPELALKLLVRIFPYINTEEEAVDLLPYVAACYHDMKDDMMALFYLKMAVDKGATNLQEIFGEFLPEGVQPSEYYDYYYYSVYGCWPDDAGAAASSSL